MRALIVLGGDAPTPALLSRCMRKAELVIAADSGLSAFDRAGLEPDWLVGDMDSVPPQVLARFEGRLPERRLHCIKDDTDGMACVRFILDAKPTEVVLTGASG